MLYSKRTGWPELLTFYHFTVVFSSVHQHYTANTLTLGTIIIIKTISNEFDEWLMGISHQAPSMTLNINIKGRWWSVECLLQSAEAVTVHSSFSAALVHSRLFINACCCWQHLDAPIRKMWRNAEAPATVNKPLVREQLRETAVFESAAKSLLLKCLFYRMRKWKKNTSLCLLLMDWVRGGDRSSRQSRALHNTA